MQTNLREIQVVGPNTREWIVYNHECPALAHRGIQYTGVTQAAGGFEFCRFSPEFAVVFGSLAGSGRVLADGEWKDCGEGDVYIAPAAVLHAYHAVEGEEWRLCWIVYEGDVGFRLIQSKRPFLCRGSSRSLQDAIMGLYDEVHALNEEAAVHNWAELIDLSARRLIQERKVDERLWTLWRTVETEIGRPWTLQSLASQVHLSTEELRHLCQKYFGRSPMKYLTELRMKQAAGLLIRTNQKIATISTDVGYHNAFAFSTAFKRVMGVSPSGFLEARTGLSKRKSNT